MKIPFPLWLKEFLIVMLVISALFLFPLLIDGQFRTLLTAWQEVIFAPFQVAAIAFTNFMEGHSFADGIIFIIIWAVFFSSLLLLRSGQKRRRWIGWSLWGLVWSSLTLISVGALIV